LNSGVKYSVYPLLNNVKSKSSSRGKGRGRNGKFVSGLIRNFDFGRAMEGGAIFIEPK
jgi:hypothetical protein